MEFLPNEAKNILPTEALRIKGSQAGPPLSIH